MTDRPDLIQRLRERCGHDSRSVDGCLDCEAADALEHNSSVLVDKDREIDRLRAALADAIEEVESWGAYASEYFQDKHDLAGVLTRLREALRAGDGGSDRHA